MGRLDGTKLREYIWRRWCRAPDSALRLKRALAMLYDDFGDLRPSPLSRAASSASAMFSSHSEEKAPDADDDDVPGAFG